MSPGLQRQRRLFVLELVKEPQRRPADLLERVDRAVAAPLQPRRVVAGARVGERALRGVVDPVKRRDEHLVGSRVVMRKLPVDMPQQSGRRVRGPGQAVGQAVRDRHHDGRGRSMAADIRDQDSPAPVRQREEVVIVAAGPPRRAVVRRQLQGGNLGQDLRQERPLDVGDHLELALDDLVGVLQLIPQNQVMRHPAEQAADPEPLGKRFRIEGGRLRLQRDDHVERHALVVVWRRPSTSGNPTGTRWPDRRRRARGVISSISRGSSP